MYSDGCYRFNTAREHECDIETFEQALAAAPGARPAAAALPDLQRAVAAYRGDFLAGMAAGEWAQARRDELARSFESALLAIGRLHAAAGRYQPAAALLLRLGCVALLAWIGYIHLHLWQEGYRQIPTDGPLFLLDAVAAFLLAAVLLLWPRPLVGLLAAGYTASTLGALGISLTVGLFGFRESISASFVTESLTIETITDVISAIFM